MFFSSTTKKENDLLNVSTKTAENTVKGGRVNKIYMWWKDGIKTALTNSKSLSLKPRSHDETLSLIFMSQENVGSLRPLR